MKTFIYILFIACFANYAGAQKGAVNIEQDKKLEDLLVIYKLYNEGNEFYRIQVGFGSHDKAQKIKSNVEIDFPEMYLKIDFDSPTYRVRLGRFKTKLEGERKLQEVRRKYPAAMLLKPKKIEL
jgi:hypothetical protein